MAEILHPGVYVNEKKSDNLAIEGVGTSTAGFVGFTRRGPLNTPVLVTSWTDFVNKFAYGLDSPFSANANLTYSVYGFFQNGGTRAYIVRVAKDTAKKASVTYTDGNTTPTDVLKVEALEEGTWGNNISVRLTNNQDGTYKFEVKYNGAVVATYDPVNFDNTSDNFIEYKVNGIDKFVKVTYFSGTVATDEVGTDKQLSGGNDGIDSNMETELINGFNHFDTVKVNLLVCPESQSTAVNQAGLTYAEQHGAFYIMDGLMNATVDSIQTERDKYNSEYGALYFPWIKVYDPVAKGQDKTRYVPVGGHVAGVIARTDALRGVHKPPAGIEAVVHGALDVKVKVTDAEQDLLNPKGINVVRPIPGAGIVVWGARTVSSNPDVRYANVRRYLLYIRESLQNGMLWAVFEPNNEDLWRKMTNTARAFLLGEFQKGALKGATPEEAFFVKCDAELNPQSEIDAGRVNMQVGLAVVKPAEFVVITITQQVGGGN